MISIDIKFVALVGVALCLASCSDGGGGGVGGGLTGQGGSTARFVVLEDRLFALTTSEKVLQVGAFYDLLRVFDIGTNPDSPALIGDVPVAVDAETLVSDGEHLFLGTANGMQILEMSDPDAPSDLSFFGHARSCDPVVIQGNYSYISVRSSEFRCWGTLNELIVVDITDLEKPSQVLRYPMTFPWGLAIDDNLLFVCDGSAGLRILDAADPSSLEDSGGVPEEICVDLIATNGKLVTTGFAGVAQYEYTTLPPTRLSLIPVVPASD